MSQTQLSRRLTALEHQRRGSGKVVIVDVTFDETGTRELAPEEVEARLCAAREEAGPTGVVVQWAYEDMPGEQE